MRALRWLFILFQFAWLNVVVPGHTRGAVTLAGGKHLRPCCCSCQRQSSNPTKPGQPTPADRANCAICYFAASVCTPPPVLCAPAPTGIIAILPIPAPLALVSWHIPLAFHGRAPPIA